jgi:hypothetical protein
MSAKIFWSLVTVTGLSLLLPGARAIALTPESNATFDLLAQVEVEGCPRASTIEAYETDTYLAYICETYDGDFFYLGVNKYDGSQVNVMGVLSTDSGTYYATNGSVTYWVDAYQLQVTQDGEVIFSEPVW